MQPKTSFKQQHEKLFFFLSLTSGYNMYTT